MTFSYLSVDGLLDPSDLIDQLVPIFFHHLEGEPVFRVDHPDEKETIGLKLVERNV